MFFICSFQVLQYGQSEYVRAFGMNVTPTPISVSARVIPPPMLRYGPGSAEATIVSWLSDLLGFLLMTFSDRNLSTASGICQYFIYLRIIIRSSQRRYRRDKKLFRPATVRTWTIVIYESRGRFREDTARDMAKGFIDGALSVGKYIFYFIAFLLDKI